MRTEDATKAKELFGEFFRKNPGVRNPTDQNHPAKRAYAQEVGIDCFVLMQTARKEHTKSGGWPNPWTKPEYWNGEAEVRQQKADRFERLKQQVQATWKQISEDQKDDFVEWLNNFVTAELTQPE
jgi:hypothetical protein